MYNRPTQKLFRTSLVIILVGFLMNLAALADVVTIDGIHINPLQPTNADLIEMRTYGWIGYAFDIVLLDSESHISGTSIDLDFYFQDSNPGGTRLPVSEEWESTAPIGTLSPDTYYVTSRVWVTEDPIFPHYYRLADTHSISFTVVPEPATLFLFGLPGLALVMKRRRHFL